MWTQKLGLRRTYYEVWSETKADTILYRMIHQVIPAQIWYSLHCYSPFRLLSALSHMPLDSIPQLNSNCRSMCTLVRKYTLGQWRFHLMTKSTHVKISCWYLLHDTDIFIMIYLKAAKHRTNLDVLRSLSVKHSWALGREQFGYEGPWDTPPRGQAEGSCDAVTASWKLRNESLSTHRVNHALLQYHCEPVVTMRYYSIAAKFIVTMRYYSITASL